MPPGCDLPVLPEGTQKAVTLRRYPPVGVDDLAEGQLAAHFQVALMLRKV